MRSALGKGLLLISLAAAAFVVADPVNGDAQGINLRTQVSGLLQPANGGFGLNVSTMSGCPLFANGTVTITPANCISSSSNAISIQGNLVSGTAPSQSTTLVWNAQDGNYDIRKLTQSDIVTPGTANQMLISNGGGAMGVSNATLDAAGDFSGATAKLTGTLTSIGVNGIIAGPPAGNLLDPTGATDSTTALQAMLDEAYAAQQNTVELPAGSYLVADNHVPLIMRTGVTLRGQGQGATTLKMGRGMVSTFSTWTCARSDGSACTSGSGPYYVTMTFPAGSTPLGFLANQDTYISMGTNPQGIAGCSVGASYGLGGTNNTIYTTIPITPVSGAGSYAYDAYLFLPGCTNATNAPSSTVLQIEIDNGAAPTANSGGSGSFFFTAPSIMVYNYRCCMTDGYSDEHNYALTDLTIDGGCNICSTANSGAPIAALGLIHKHQIAGGFVSQGRIENVTFQNLAQDAIYSIADSDEVMTNITCTNVGYGCIAGVAASNYTITNLTGTGIGFPFQGQTGLYYSNLAGTDVCCSGYHDYTIATATATPRVDPKNVFFGIGFYQNGASPDATHKLMRGVTVRNYVQHSNCQSNGGLFTGFVDDLLIDGITADFDSCPAYYGAESFVEIGGSGNRVTNGHNVSVVWAGIDNVFTHAIGALEADHLKWNSPLTVNTQLVSVSGQQAGGTTACIIDGVDIHDNSGYFIFSPGPNLASAFGVGQGEGSATCAIRSPLIHYNTIFASTPSGAHAAFISAAGPGNGTIAHQNWDINHNHLFGFTSLLSSVCEYQGGSYSTGSPVQFNATNLTIQNNVTDLASTGVIDTTTFTSAPTNPPLASCPAVTWTAANATLFRNAFTDVPNLTLPLPVITPNTPTSGASCTVKGWSLGNDGHLYFCNGTTQTQPL